LTIEKQPRGIKYFFIGIGVDVGIGVGVGSMTRKTAMPIPKASHAKLKKQMALTL